MGVAVEQDPNDRTVVERRDPLVGHVFDRRFRVEARIAAGGFGAIYRATHLKSGHEFALKILHANLTTDPRVVARFRREGAALIRLRDPHTITAYELGEAENGTLYIVMELLHGESLYERYRARGAMPWQRVIAIGRAVCSSLVEAHALGVIHRDLKPTNIHLEQRGGVDDFVKVLDFGIAKILHDSDIDSSDLTNAGQMVGTVDYMPPEQMIGGTCTATSDIYTLGVVMYEMIAGKKPFEDANSATAALAAMLTATPDRLSACAMVTPQVDHLVMKCIERAQADRYQTAVELAAALDELMVGDEQATEVAMTTLTGTDAPRHHTPPPKQITPVPSVYATTLPLPVRRDLVPAVAKSDRREVVPVAAQTARRDGAPAAAKTDRRDALVGAKERGDALAADKAERREPAAKADRGDAVPAAKTERRDAVSAPKTERRDVVPAGKPERRDAVSTSRTERRDVVAATKERRDPTPRTARRASERTPAPEIVDLNSTILGHLPAARSAPTPLGTPHIGMRIPTPASGIPVAAPPLAPLVPTVNLREAYPMINRPAPSAMRSPFDDRPPSSVNVLPFDAAAARRDVLIRRAIIALSCAIAVLAGILLVTHR